nr:MAG TPA: hypothetical protein [Caudoviricetes sp.]
MQSYYNTFEIQKSIVFQKFFCFFGKKTCAFQKTMYNIFEVKI